MKKAVISDFVAHRLMKTVSLKIGISTVKMATILGDSWQDILMDLIGKVEKNLLSNFSHLIQTFDHEFLSTFLSFAKQRNVLLDDENIRFDIYFLVSDFCLQMTYLFIQPSWKLPAVLRRPPRSEFHFGHPHTQGQYPALAWSHFVDMTQTPSDKTGPKLGHVKLILE